MPSLALTSLALGGDAVGRLPGKDGASGKAVFVPFGAPEDRAEITVTENHKTYSRGWIASLLEASPRRVDPPCPHFFRPGAAPEAVCGGCQWQHLAYPFQTESKQRLLTETLERLGRIARPPVEQTLAVDDPDRGPWRYRNKMQIPFAVGPEGKLAAGFYAPGTRRIVPFEDCLLQSESANVLFRAVREWFRRPGSGAEALRHLLIRSTSRGDTLAALVVTSDKIPGLREFARHVVSLNRNVKSLFLNLNTRADGVIVGAQWKRLHGAPFLWEEIQGRRFRLSPGAFFQVHHAMAEKLYALAEAMAAPAPEETAVELYCGVGAMALGLAAKARFVWGVEENSEAVADAIESARTNGVTNVRFLTGRCESVLARGRFHGGPGGALGAVVLDPPRAGCDPKVLKGVLRLAPKRIVYVSCDPGTLARDARLLASGGYHLRRCVPVDLFPQTAHIESVSLFTPAG
jgi:23S rRNA (uracil1939-C5)-methyltransferase